MSAVVGTSGRFDGSVALVVGGTSGIGAATAERLVAEGASVVLTGRDVERGEALIPGLGESAAFVAADITERDTIDALVAEVDRRFGRLDVLVNSAGVVAVRPFATMSTDHWRTTIGANLDGVFHTCQAALPLLRRTASDGGAGGSTAIVNVASLNGIGGDTGMTAYGAAKAGVIAMTRSLALEMIEHGVRVNCVSPGAIDTPMTAATTSDGDRAAAFETAIPIGRYGRPDEIAAAIAFVASADASFMVGANLVVDGGVTSASGHPDLLAMFDMQT